jgi:hypothetical protein
MRKLFVLGVALAMASSAFAAPNVTNVTQKGSLLIWPDIRVDADGVEGTWDTLVRISNDGSLDVDVICYWMDGNKNRVDFIITVTRNMPAWFNAWTGNGVPNVNRFPQSLANGFDNPFLISPGFTTEAADVNTAYHRGLLACWAIDGGAQNQVKWNHLSGTATVYNANIGAYEYNAYAFFVPTGLDQEPVGITPGTLNLNGVEYDSCPLYQIGQFTPVDVALPANQQPNTEPLNTPGGNPLSVWGNRLALTGCNINLNQDWVPVWTKLQFDVWNEDEVRFTGAFECADTWHETVFADPFLFPTTAANTASLGHGWIDSGAQNFQASTLQTFNARYRVQGVKSTQCEDASAKPPRITQAVGVIAVQSSSVSVNNARPSDMVGTTLAAAGKFTGRIVWDPEGPVPEGGIR